MYNKLFSKILDSSIWLEPSPTRIVWLTLIAVMDEDGFAQFASIANLAHRARVTTEEAGKAVACLEAADLNSSNPDHDGRRVERVPGGWLILNAQAHRGMVTREASREAVRARVRKHRAKRNASVTPQLLQSGTCNASEAVSGSEVQDLSVHAREPKRLAYGGHILKLSHRQHEVLVGMCNAVPLDLLGEVYPRWDRELEASGEPFDPLSWCTAKLRQELGIRAPQTPTEAEYREAEGILQRLEGRCNHQPVCADREACVAKYALRLMLKRTKPMAVRGR